MLNQELASLAVRSDLLAAQRDKSALDLKAMKARQQALETAANDRRRANAEAAREQAKEAETAAKDKAPVIQQMARDNSALGEDIAVLTARLDRVEAEGRATGAEVKGIEEDFRSARERLEIVGSNRALGQVLAEKRRDLPDLRRYRKAIAEREEEIADTSLAEIRRRDERRALRDLDTYMDKALAGIPADQQASLRDELETLVRRRLALLDQLRTTADAQVRALVDLNYASQQLISTAEAYSGYLSERLLWVRSVEPLDRAAIAAIPGAFAWLLSPSHWGEVLQTLAYQATHPVHALLFWALAIVAAILALRGPVQRRAILATAGPMRRVNTDSFGLTLKAIALSALVAAPVSLALALVGWQLASSLEAGPFAKQVGGALLSISVLLYYLRSFRILCIPGGVADKHFRWPADALARLRRSFDWLAYLLLPVGFVALVIYNSDDATHAGSLGRMAVLLLLVGIAIIFARLLHPRAGPLRAFLAGNPRSLANRLRGLWYPLVVGVPLVLAGLALAGYLHTAGTLLQSIVHTLWLALALILVHQTIARWLLVTRRQLALEAALERQAARKAEPRPEGEEVVAEEAAVDLASLDNQTRRLVSAVVIGAGFFGLWGVWSDVLPAFTALDRFALWQHTGLVDGVEAQVPVTLGDILLVTAIILVSAIAARNLPAVLEILLLQHTELSSGSRYTATTLTKYAITIAGALLVFSTLGLSWSKVQWLVAALGVGIGFGLQEIVANFISGLIILFERPVRVGDVVTIGGVTGTISRIQIRATTIRNWDQQELLVPNKQFITGDLLNWSLTDSINRVVVTVGVDYGADTRLAMALLLDVARENQHVLKEPPPLVAFQGFGDNALTLSLRCYLGSMEGRLMVTTELHQAVYDKLKAAGIGIAYPQRDVHLTADRPLDIRVHRRQPPATPA
jgi:potassium-dependent mechanosensitive channel